MVFGAALLLLIAAVPAGAAVSLKEKIREKEHLLRKTELKEKSILRELRDLAREISRLGREIALLEKETAIIRQEIARIEKRIKAINEQEDLLRDRLSRELAVFSTLSRTAWLNLLFAPREINAFLRREDYLEAIIQNELQKLRELKAYREKLLTLKKERERELALLGKREEQLRRKKKELLLVRKEKETLLEAVRKNKRLYRETLDLLLAAQEEIEKLAREITATRRKLEKMSQEKARPSSPGIVLRPLFEVKGFLRPPVSGRVLRFFGLDRDLFTGKISFSPGIFIGAPPGTEVRAPFSARVVRLKWVEGRGKVLVLDHGYGFVSVIGGLSEIKVLPGTEVSTGEVLGRVGASPFGPSGVYYELRYEGKPQNPLEWLNLKYLRLVR